MPWIFHPRLPSELLPPRPLRLVCWYIVIGLMVFVVTGTFITQGPFTGAETLTAWFLLVPVARALVLASYAKVMLYKLRRSRRLT